MNFNEFNGKEYAGFIIAIVNIVAFISVSIYAYNNKTSGSEKFLIGIILFILLVSFVFTFISLSSKNSDMALHFSLVPYYGLGFCLFMLSLFWVLDKYNR